MFNMSMWLIVRLCLPVTGAVGFTSLYIVATLRISFDEKFHLLLVTSLSFLMFAGVWKVIKGL
jgi:hypothetical protein